MNNFIEGPHKRFAHFSFSFIYQRSFCALCTHRRMWFTMFANFNWRSLILSLWKKGEQELNKLYLIFLDFAKDEVPRNKLLLPIVSIIPFSPSLSLFLSSPYRYSISVIFCILVVSAKKLPENPFTCKLYFIKEPKNPFMRGSCGLSMALLPLETKTTLPKRQKGSTTRLFWLFKCICAGKIYIWLFQTQKLNLKLILNVF